MLRSKENKRMVTGFEYRLLEKGKSMYPLVSKEVMLKIPIFEKI